MLVSCSSKKEVGQFKIEIANTNSQPIELRVGEKTAAYIKKRDSWMHRKDFFPFPMSFTPPSATIIIGDKSYYWHGTGHLAAVNEGVFTVDKELFNVHSYKKSGRFPAIRRYMMDIYREKREAYYKKYPPKRETLQKEYQELLDHIESQL